MLYEFNINKKMFNFNKSYKKYPKYLNYPQENKGTKKKWNTEQVRKKKIFLPSQITNSSNYKF